VQHIRVRRLVLSVHPDKVRTRHTKTVAQRSVGHQEYANGTGVAQDPVRAYVLLALAAAKATGNDATRYGGARDTVGAALTPEQLAEAQASARQGSMPWPALP